MDQDVLYTKSIYFDIQGNLKGVVTCFLDAPLYLEGTLKKVVTCFLDAPLYLEGTLKKAVTCFLNAPLCYLNVQLQGSVA